MMTTVRPGDPGWSAVARAWSPLRGLDVVDLGCGRGEVAAWAVQQGARSVLALDLDAERLDVARATRPDPRVHHEQADLDQATLPFEAYDVAWCPVLERLEDPVRFGRMTRAGLRPGGLLLVLLGGRREALLTALAEAGLDLVSTLEVGAGTQVARLSKPARGTGRPR